ncbi:hypothetical protein [Laspinema olomoucense]|uniref:hypothetical protein n=1 Tax=Laspinema olomoucense TaxID=3231600 RepID=UPI0021BB699C|nr:hypothetical protein [Laspinema sp. D3d]
MTTTLPDYGRVPTRLAVKRHFEVENRPQKEQYYTSMTINFKTEEVYQKNLVFLNLFFLLNTLPPEVLEMAISQLSQLVQDYVGGPVTPPSLTQVTQKSSTSWPVVTVSTGFKVKQPAQVSDRETFERLKLEWKEATEMLSSITKKIKHPAYQEIIGMGDKVLPWILEELQKEPSHWFSALSAITKVDPVTADDNFEQAVEAWLNWGRSQGYIQ